MSDGLGRLAEVYTFRGTYSAPTWAAPPLAVARYRFNALDRHTGVRDPLGNRIRIAYDPLGRKVRLSDPAMGTWFYGTMRRATSSPRWTRGVWR